MEIERLSRGFKYILLHCCGHGNFASFQFFKEQVKFESLDQSLKKLKSCIKTVWECCQGTDNSGYQRNTEIDKNHYFLAKKGSLWPKFFNEPPVTEILLDILFEGIKQIDVMNESTLQAILCSFINSLEPHLEVNGKRHFLKKGTSYLLSHEGSVNLAKQKITQ